MTEWYTEWFGEEYLALYAHRDSEDAQQLISLLRRVLPWERTWRVLDVGCGPGRHAEVLAHPGERPPVGVDLSMTLLRRAQQVSNGPLVQADMRLLPLRAGAFDLTVNLFTSFGYFQNDGEHVVALREMIHTVRPGGWFVLDYLNPAAVKEGLVEDETTSMNGEDVRIQRSLGPGEAHVIKTFRLANGNQFMERVRLFTVPDLETMITEAGAVVRHHFGDYLGSAPDRASPRSLLLAERTSC